jgi:hypothetical protein
MQVHDDPRRALVEGLLGPMTDEEYEEDCRRMDAAARASRTGLQTFIRRIDGVRSWISRQLVTVADWVWPVSW